jgi:hypothetical protein
MFFVAKTDDFAASIFSQKANDERQLSREVPGFSL